MKEFACVVGFVYGMLLSVPGFAAGVIEAANGQVRAGMSSATATAVAVGQRIAAGTVISTGPKSRAVVRFDDGQAMILHESSEFRVAEYSFSREQPAKDKFNFELVRGALRSITSAFTRRSPRAYALRTTTVTMGVRGTDFLVASVNPTYVRVLNGAVLLFNTAGAVTFNEGSAGMVASDGTLPITIALSDLPPAIGAAFIDLAGVGITELGSQQVASLFAQFPNGGGGLAAAIAALLIANPALANDVAQAARSGNTAQQQAAGSGMGDAIDNLTRACSTQPCSPTRVGGPSGIAQAVRTSGSLELLAAASASSGGFLSVDGVYVPPAAFVTINRTVLNQLGLCTGSPC